MGIPKFYRWTSERYPCLYEKIREYQIPEFDNLYLDMNGIIHNCSHPNDEDVHLRIPEEHIFRDIFHYIDFLFRMIKPCKVFFMAIDGVAPRAKMNQQRGRRFRSARVAEEQEAEALRQGEQLPSEERFDSNCITPGTEFMARLHEQLKYFVSVKVSTDPLWQRKGLVVYLSGHDVPGEGEHKIMDFIRHIRSRVDYDPETRHCLYGLDADLMMLGLSTHELRFSLLREEVKFAKPKKKKPAKGSPQKKPKNKTEKDPYLYKHENVSIFANENAIAVGPTDSILKPPTMTSVGNWSNDQSFVDAINKVPVPELKDKTVAIASQETDNTPPPPPSSDANAKGDYKAPLPEKTTFFLLHLSLFRDYLDEEFKDLRTNLTDHPNIKYNLESIIDDWILMNILVGNDFVPHLPNLHIVKGALPMLYRTYMDVLPTLDGYLNENGNLNLQRFEKFITKLSQFDLDQFRETYDDMKYKASKTGKNIVLGEKMFEDFIFEDNTPFEEDELEPISDELKELAKRTNDEIFGEVKSDGSGLKCKEIFPEDDEFFSPEDTEEFRLEFLQHKRNYYLTKCEFPEVGRDAVREFAIEYIRAIQWVLLYYYKGVSSWGWYYPSHYAPYASDLRGFSSYQIEFVKGQPFKPFEQLLAVLPSQSKKLLPMCYQWLMTEENSPILEYYPKKFEQDLNGKRQDWEAVVLIPFIDESKLLNAMEEEAKKLSQEEQFRNLRGSLLCYSYTPEPTGPVKSHRDIFPELEVSHYKLERIAEVTYNPKLLPKGLHPKAKIKKIYQGFPSLKSKRFESSLCKADVKVFEFYAREESLILSFESEAEDMDGLTLAKRVLGHSVWVNWPHLESALVTSVLTRNGKFVLGRDNLVVKDHKTSDDSARKTFDIMAKGIVDRHLKFRGIRLGELNIIIFARLMEGRKMRCNSSGKVIIENQWSKIEQPFALKTTIFEERVTEMFYMDQETAKSYVDLFRKDDQVFYLGDKLFGALGVVTDHDKGSGSVIVDFESPQDDDEGNLKMKTGLRQLKSQEFFPPYRAAQMANISSFALSRLTGRVLVAVEKTKRHSKKNPKVKKQGVEGTISVSDSSESSEEDFPALEPEIQKFNIGLDLKFNKTNMEVRGYTSKRDGQWCYSVNAVKLVNEYVSEFPDVVDLLGRSDKNKDVYSAADIFPDDPAGRTAEIVQWLEDKGVRNLPRIPTNCNVLDDEDIDNVWKYILSRKSKSQTTSVKHWSVRPNLLYKPGLDKGCIAPIPSQFDMLDRIICVDRGCAVPLGTRGTVVGKQEPPKIVNDDNEESFKTISTDAQYGLIIMCDPITDIFEPKINTKDDKNLTELTGSLAKLLGVNGALQQPIEPAKPKPAIPVLKPKLVKLFPYQVINLTQGARRLRQDLKKVPVPAQSGNSKNQLPNTNGTVIIKKSYAQSVGPSKPDTNSTGIKILQKPQTTQGAINKEPAKIPPLIQKNETQQYNSSNEVLPWPPQPKNRSITVEQLFAQAAKNQKSQTTTEEKKSENSKSLPKQNAKKSPLKGGNVSKIVDENKLPNTSGVTKRQPAFAESLNASKSTSNQQQKGIQTKVFVNSSFQAKGRDKPDKPQASSSAGLDKKNQSSSSNKSQILDLLCQPKNMERVNTTTTSNSKPQGNSTNVVNGNHQSKTSGNNSAQFHYNQQVHSMMAPVGIANHAAFVHAGFMNHNPPPQPLYYVPTPYPVILPGQNPHASAFTPQAVHYSNLPMQPAMFPPQPPQHWTHSRNGGDNSNAHFQRMGENQGGRPSRSNNVFVPLQVSRSLASGDSEVPGRRREQHIEPEIQQPTGNMRNSSQATGPVESTLPASNTLKELLGVTAGTQNDAVPQPRKSRIAANFGA